jgi:hypothetical protein
MTSIHPDQRIVHEGDWVRWKRHGMPKAVTSQVYVNSRGNYCVGGYPFRKGTPVIGIWALPMFEEFTLARLAGGHQSREGTSNAHRIHN